MIKKVTERSSAFVVLSRKTLITGIIGIAVISFALGYFFGYGSPSSGKLVKHVEAVSNGVPSVEKAVPGLTGKHADVPAAKKKKSGQWTGEKKLSGKSYALQVGAFRDPQKARLLKQELDSKGYNSYIMSYAPDKGKTFSRVRIGPYDSRQPAAALIPELKKQGFECMIVPGQRQV